MTSSIITADQISAYRERLGWSQKRLADELGISQVAVHRYENGSSIPGPTQQLLKIWIEQDHEQDQPANPSDTPVEAQGVS